MAKKISAIFIIEIMAGKKEVTEDAMEKYMEKVKSQKYLTILKEDFSEINHVKSPNDQIKEAFWQSVEIEAEFDTLKNLLFFIMTYGPSSIEIMAPKSMEIKMHEIQEMAGALAEFMHRYAAQGAGGIVLSQK